VVTKLIGKVPYVINADDLAAQPERVIRKLCDYLQIEFFAPRHDMETRMSTTVENLEKLACGGGEQ